MKKMTRIMSTLHEYLYTFMKIFHRTLLRIRIASDKVVEKVKTHTLCSIVFFRKSYRTWDNVGGKMVEPHRPRITI